LQRVKFDPLRNSGTSRVFYKLLTDFRTPKHISSALGIKPSSVIEHLRRLQRVGIVRFGEKRGKFQYYEIDFEFFLPIFIERAFQEKKTHPSRLYPDETKELKPLKDNKYFKDFIVKYLKSVRSIETIDSAAKAFENGLLLSRTLKRKRKEYSDAEKQQFFDKMIFWRRIVEQKKTYAEVFLQDALTRTLNPKKDREEP